MNVKRLREIRKLIVSRPQHFDMGGWVYGTECGTVCCIGGWGTVLGGYRKRDGRLGAKAYKHADLLIGFTDVAESAAGHSLGLSVDAARRLFYVWELYTLLPRLNGVV